MVRALNQERPDTASEPNWKPLEYDVLARVKYVARRIVERVERVTAGDQTRRVGPDDPTDEIPAFS